MPTKLPRVIVAGDAAIDWVQWPVRAEDLAVSDGRPPNNWQLVSGHRMIALHGGAMLLAHMVATAIGEGVFSYEVDEKKLAVIPPDDILHSLSFLKEFPWFADPKLQEKDKRAVYRVDKLCGFVGPPEDSPVPLRLKPSDIKPRVIVLDDAGNGFRYCDAAWPEALNVRGRKPLVVMKMSQPLAEGPLWDYVTGRHSERLVVVINADDLRRKSGVNICRRLSWERTAGDFVWQMANNSDLAHLAKLRHLVVRCAADGAIHYSSGDKGPQSVLYYDHAVAEEGFSDEHPGGMLGYTSAFVAAIVARVLKKGLDGVGEGAREGILCCRRLLQHGFGEAPKPPAPRTFEPAYPVTKIFKAPDARQRESRPWAVERTIFGIPIPAALPTTGVSCSGWSILKEKQSRLEELAYRIVNRGVDGGDGDFTAVPVAQFGRLKTADLSEMESLRSIRNIILEYEQSGSAKSPLCIAVFGPPGSGKSFGVEEVAKTVAPGKIEPMEFNVAQFGSQKDLTRALHQVHDKFLGGKLPLVFFDEFDSRFESEELGWLKYFLLPMQAGAFLDGETEHPIGKAIFVFAGGTANNFAAFCRENVTDPKEAGRQKETFRKSKGPDFVSRLRGHIDILGPDPLGEDDLFAMIRRAVALRTQLERKAEALKALSEDKANYLIDGKGEALIDPGVLRAFIKVPRYKHGMRSMQAVIDMSMLAGRKQFEQAALPAPEQLDLHVDAEAFCRLVVHDTLLGSAREKIARAFHEAYRRHQKGKQSKAAVAMRPWSRLPNDLKEANLQEADQIPDKLRRVGYRLGPRIDSSAKNQKFTPQELEILAEMEHERWMKEKFADGWTYGRRKNRKRKTNPCLVPWADRRLTKGEKDKDREAVRNIPKILDNAGFEMYRIRSANGAPPPGPG